MYICLSNANSPYQKTTLEDFAQDYPGSKNPLTDWAQKLKYADWDQPGDIKQTYNTADVLGKSSNRVVFDIGGNNYRMICKYFFGTKQPHLFVCWIGLMLNTISCAKKENSIPLIFIRIWKRRE